MKTPNTNMSHSNWNYYKLRCNIPKQGSSRLNKILIFIEQECVFCVVLDFRPHQSVNARSNVIYLWALLVYHFMFEPTLSNLYSCVLVFLKLCMLYVLSFF